MTEPELTDHERRLEQRPDILAAIEDAHRHPEKLVRRQRPGRQ